MKALINWLKEENGGYGTFDEAPMPNWVGLLYTAGVFGAIFLAIMLAAK